MRKFQYSFLTMVIIVLMFSLAACSSKETGGEKEPVKVKDPDSVAEVEDEETYDLGGRVIRIANNWDMTPEAGTEIGDLMVERWKSVEEKYNVKVEMVVVPWEEKVNQLTSTVLAGEPFADIVGLDSAQTASLVQQDYLIPLDDIIDLSASKIPDALKELGTFNDKVYMMNNQLNQSGGMYYNKTLFEQAGLPDPYELQEAGEWTWDAMLDAAKKLTNGTTYGLSMDPNLLAEYLITTNDAKILDASSAEVTIDSANAMEGLNFMAALYNEYKVVKPNEGNNWEDPRKYFSEWLVGMTQGWVWEAEGRGEIPFDWGYVFWPKGPKASDYVTVVSNSEGLVIPAGVKDPEMVYQIWEEIQTWEVAEDAVVEWFEIVLPTESAVNTATQMLEHISANYWPAYNLQDAFYDTMGNISSGAESPSQAIAKVKSVAQARVDEFIGK